MNSTTDHSNYVQSEWYCESCKANHLGNCPKVKTTLTMTAPTDHTDGNQMTNYNERLDELLANLVNQVVANEQRLLNGNATRKATIDSDSHATTQAKQAITSLTKELVAEAKPEKHLVQEDSEIYDDYDHDREQLRHELQENNINIGHNSAIDEFEQNLLKALEDK